MEFLEPLFKTDPLLAVLIGGILLTAIVGFMMPESLIVSIPLLLILTIVYLSANISLGGGIAIAGVAIAIAIYFGLQKKSLSLNQEAIGRAEQKKG